MPIFEYRCENCGETSEFLILGKNERVQCGHCGSEDLTKLMSAHNPSLSSPERISEKGPGTCCGSPHSCGTPGGCCSR